MKRLKTINYLLSFLMLGLSACQSPVPVNTDANGFKILAKKESPANPNKNHPKKMPQATSYGVVNGQNVPFSYGDEGFLTQSLVDPTSCYSCRWNAMNLTASYVQADYAPGGDSLNLESPDVNNSNAPNGSSGYHFSVVPKETGTDVNGDPITTRLNVYMRVEAYQGALSGVDRIESFKRYLVTGNVEFTSTDGINFVFDSTTGYESIINSTKVKDSPWCQVANSEAKGRASGGTVVLKPLTGEADISIQSSLPAKATIGDGCYSPTQYKYGTNTLNMTVTAQLNYSDPNPTPTPTPTSTVTPSPSPSASPSPSPEPSPTAAPDDDCDEVDTQELREIIRGFESFATSAGGLGDILSSYQTQGFSILAVPECDSNDAQCLAGANRYRHIEDYAQEIIKNTEPLTPAEIFQLESLKTRIDSYTSLAFSVGTNGSIILFSGPVGVEYGLAVESAALFDILKAMSPRLQSHLMANPLFRASFTGFLKSSRLFAAKAAASLSHKLDSLKPNQLAMCPAGGNYDALKDIGKIGKSIDDIENDIAVYAKNYNKGNNKSKKKRVYTPEELKSHTIRKLGNLIDDSNKLLRDVIYERGGNKGNVNAAKHWADKTLYETAEGAVLGEKYAEGALKIAKQAYKKDQKY